MKAYPRTIDNGGGEELTFVGVRSDERGEYLEVRNVVSPGAGRRCTSIASRRRG